MAVADYFKTAADTDFARDAAVVTAGYIAPNILAGPIEGFVVPHLPVSDVPNEVHGILTVVGAEAALSGADKTLVQYGGGVYTVESLLERFGVQDALAGMAPGAN